MATAIKSELAAFATRVKTAAARCGKADRFGDDKVFISAIARDLGVRNREVFERNLLDAHTDGLLTLSRADLIAAMDPAVVAASTVESTSMLGGRRRVDATFHFVRLDR